MLDIVLRNLETMIFIILIALNSSGLNFYEIPNSKVIKVIDGDTIEVHLNNKIEKVRLLGLNTPESVDPRKKLECFGIEASEKLNEILYGKIVRLEADSNYQDRDKFGRLLRYVFVDGENINQRIIAEGYGFEYTYNRIPYKYQKEFKVSQMDAEIKNIGLWDEKNCNY